MSDDQPYSEPWHSQDSLFKHFQGYLGIFRDIDAYSVTLKGAQLGEESRGSLPFPFLIIEKGALIWENKALIMSIFGLNLPFKCSFNSI